jgi:uncharacterized protein (DUF1778 family)
MSRLTIDMTDKQHQTLKAMAALQGKTIKQFALEKLFAQAGGAADWADEDEAAWNEFVTEMEKRAEEAIAGNVSDRSPEEIIEAAIRKAKAVA